MSRMIRWIPYIEQPAPVIVAGTAQSAAAKARALYGAGFVRVQSVASAAVGAEEIRTAGRDRRLGYGRDLDEEG